MDINSNADNTPSAEVELRGNATEPLVPEISLAPSDVDFGNAEIDDTLRFDITIRNIGTGPLDVESATIVSGGAGGFGVDTDNQIPVTIEPGSEVTIAATFTPDTEGNVDGTLRVTSSDEANPQAEVSLRGTGVPVPVAQIRATPQSLRFRETERGNTETLELILANNGNRRLQVSEIVIEGDTQAGFEFPDGPIDAVGIVAGGEFMLTVAFSPTGVGTFNGTVRVTSDSATDGILEIPLSGTAVEVPMPQIAVTPDPVEIGDVTVGERRTQDVVIESDGNTTLNVESVALTSGANAGFSIEDGPASSFRLEPGETRTLTVVFEPDEPGTVTGTVEVISDAVNESTLMLSLNATGQAAPEPQIGQLPDRFDFRDVDIGQQARRELVIENTGSAPLTVDAIDITEGAASGFRVENVPNLRQAIPPGNRITVDVVFAPTGDGPVTGTLAISSDDPNAPSLSIPLQGTGTVPLVARIQVEPTNLDFEGVRVEQQNTRELVISNPGTDDLQITGFTFANRNGFTLENAPGGEVTIAPNNSLTLEVAFTPTAAGEVTDELIISSTAEGEPETTVALRGEGLIAVIDVQPASLDFDTLEIGQSQTLSIDIFNDGNGALELSSVSVDEPSFLLGAVPRSIAPGAMATVEVTFMPGPDREGDIVGKMRIDNDSSNAPQVFVSLTGRVTIPAGAGVFVAQTALAFGDTTVDETVSLSVTIRSVGLASAMLLGLELGNTGEFALGDIPNLPTTLASGESMTVAIDFTPAVPGAFANSLMIESDDENAPVIDVSLNGTGIEAVATEGLQIR